eukprot:scaffold1235_cov163-Skeletonema_marinoi.AAC.2
MSYTQIRHFPVPLESGMSYFPAQLARSLDTYVVVSSCGGDKKDMLARHPTIHAYPTITASSATHIINTEEPHI